MISVRNITKSFGGVEVLQGLSFDVPRGKTAVLLGRSGSGKSTMLRCLNLLEHWDSGEIEVDGRSLGGERLADGKWRRWSSREQAQARQHIGMVFQQFNLFPHMTVLQNVMCGPRKILKKGVEESRTIAMNLLEQVGLADKKDQYPVFLSGGQQQRVAIARALAMRPQVLLLDEITSALDPELVGEVLEVVRDLKREGLTMVCVTHEMHFAHDVADEVIFLEGGRVVEQGDPREVLVRPSTEQLKRFLARFHAQGVMAGKEASL
ncbi:amino acid ABC transporter ATP-binding protein [Allopusillimonas soli]|uniref:Amino acid ABC transporter ATP-binding protein n=1 Tax=Allopusillimonas soli TaxID=659016 RepID=A0A853FH12_9BURK|nr:amino acid ABC transporter ATP-binding protein [Allopusillimonas soli]NYT37276.1 amino acid ABC transporter ATP-binding protein [Allopusillimonas soli]TEA74729.1 amino acid ABC transporter ATP-binding protein [Allopusillimonas soli]